MKRIVSALTLLCVLAIAASAQVGAVKPNEKGPQSQPTRNAQQPAKPQAPPAPVTSLPSAVQQNSDKSPVKSVVSDDFIIGPEDVLEITVWREPDLSTMKAVVRADGKIGIRLLGEVQAAGLTTKQLQDRLHDEYSRYVAEPVVSVIVTDVKSQVVHIIGSVGHQGFYNLGSPLTVMDLLARAGGLADFAKKENIVIYRTEPGKQVRIPFNYKSFVEGKNLQQNIQLRSGDLIVVP
jgi:polysaccharide export outer membrane protein